MADQEEQKKIQDDAGRSEPEISQYQNERVSIVHCADLHIDSVFSTFTPDSPKAVKRREEQLTALGRIVFLARKIGAKFLLIAGDLFDAGRVHKETLDYINDKFRMIPDVTVCITPGNHDPRMPGSPYETYNWNENVHIFGSTLDYIERDNVRVYGRAFTGHFARKSLLKGEDGALPLLDNQYINILLLHGDIYTRDSVYNPLDMNDFRSLEFDYIALGHIHKFSEIQYAGNTPYCYSGTPEGRGFDETGDCGAVLGQLSKGASKFRFVPTSVRKHVVCKIDVTDCDSTEDICSLILNTCPQNDDLYRIVLTGSLPEDFLLSAARIETILENKYFYIKIKDKTGIRMNPALLQKEISIKGLFVKNILACEDETLREAALKYGLKAFEGEVNIYDD